MISELGRSPGEGKVYSLQYSGLENSMDGIVHGFAKSGTRLRDFSPHFMELMLQLETYTTWISRDGIRVSKRMLHEQLK